MVSDRYAEFITVSRNLENFPLLAAEDIERFRVPYGQRVLARLRGDILSVGDAGKVIFTGHRGCGKSTLLAQLPRLMREDDLFVSFFSIADMVEMSDVNHINILYAIALKLLSQATKQRIPITENTKNTLINWFTQTKSRTYIDQLNQAMSAGIDFFNFFTGKLQKESVFREEIKETYERSVSDLSRQIDLIAAAIFSATRKKVLVIIDDLDKLDLPVVRSIFQENVNALFSPNVRVVFTIPISVIREPQIYAALAARSNVILLPVMKFFPKEKAHQTERVPIQSNVEMLERILEKRIPAHLIEPDMVRQIVLLSGGVLRELVRLCRECCRECLLVIDLEPETTDVKINDDILTEAVKSLRNQYARPIGTNRYAMLAQTYENFAPPDAESEEFLELLHGLYVLEYENADLWYDLHPLVADILRRKQLI
ncbi:AAA family ATPase [Oscillatoria sp. CS-180]|uniref:P-loop NTPase fold protein n=1 Tax=Oscillatoria sp. CS-180 TaxID=3021720 RepID=UPI00232D7F73|nr:P-loop NTPase fold protein [Oscillatoria sp. CS-180]MDB9526465.1 AAA family ATPase [Oscillatoria sp. CS-180]